MRGWWVALIAVACGGESGPLFSSITNVNITKVSSAGTALHTLSSSEVGPFAGCLDATSEIAPDQAEDQLLVSTYLIEVTDGNGKHSFELYTAHTLKGNHGKYYTNPCLHDQIVALGM